MFKYNIDVLKELKRAGYTTTRIRKEKILPEATVQKIRKGEIIGIKSLDVICSILNRQPNYILKHIKADQTPQDAPGTQETPRTIESPTTAGNAHTQPETAGEDPAEVDFLPFE